MNFQFPKLWNPKCWLHGTWKKFRMGELLRNRKNSVHADAADVRGVVGAGFLSAPVKKMLLIIAQKARFRREMVMFCRPQTFGPKDVTRVVLH